MLFPVVALCSNRLTIEVMVCILLRGVLRIAHYNLKLYETLEDIIISLKEMRAYSVLTKFSKA